MSSIPNSIKEALLQIKLGHCALILELIAFLDLGFSRRFTFAMIYALAMDTGITIDKQIIRRGLRELAENGLASTRPIILRTQGRPELEYSIASMEGIAKALGIKLHAFENCDSPGRDGFSSLKKFRQGLYIAFIARVPGKHSRAFMGGRLGVKKRTTRNYEKDTKIKKIENFENEELSFASIRFAPKTRQQNKFFIVSWDAEFKKSENLPYTEFLIRRELGRGRRVFKTWQAANTYSIAA